MKTMLAKLKSENLLAFALIVQFIVCLLVLFDVPVARQIIGFAYFTTIPGFIFVNVLKSDELDKLEIVLFSVGLSIAFLMLGGLLINELCFLFGFSEPLSLFPLVIILNSFILTGSLIAYLGKNGVNLLKVKIPRVPPLALLFLSLPILSVVGTIWVNAFGNNLILLCMIMAVALLFIVGTISKQAFSPKFYSFAVLMIAISLLLHSSLISKYLAFGSDIALEYICFRTTQNNAYWSSIPIYPDVLYSRMNSMLSVTILPTIYSTLLNMNATLVLKVLRPLIFSFVPLTLYQLWQKRFGKKAAFAAAFLLMAQNTFYSEMLGLTRQMIGELFFALLLLVILNKRIKRSNKAIYFMILGVALVTSHYALAEIFMLFISITYLSSVLMKQPNRNITLTMVVFFSVVMFAWYIYTSNSAVFDSFLSFGDYVFDQLGEFFNPVSRGQTVLRGLGLERAPTIWNTLSRAFAYLTEFFIGLGFIELIRRRKTITVEREHFRFITIAVAFLVALVAVPALATTMNMTRFYHILLFFLSPLCVLGTKLLVELISKRRMEIGTSILLLIVLVPYFLFQTGFVYEVAGSQSWSVPLSGYRLEALFVYRLLGCFYEQDVYGAYWISGNVDVEHSKIYADRPSKYANLGIYGMIYSDNVEILSPGTILSENSSIYLSRVNVIDGVVVSGPEALWNTTSISQIFDLTNKVYSNGGCVIYNNGKIP